MRDYHSHDGWGLQPPSTTWLVRENILQEEVHMANSDTSRKLKKQNKQTLKLEHKVYSYSAPTTKVLKK